ncbi:hypothetical protein HK102_011454, partial [Quaeritorhiza haematococci]
MAGIDWHDTLFTLLASSVAALLSRLATHPMDTVRVRMQVSSDPDGTSGQEKESSEPLLHEDSLTNASVLFGDPADETRGLREDQLNSRENANRDVTKAREKMKRKRMGTFGMLFKILREEGLRGIYTGVGTALVFSVPALTTYLVVYESSKLALSLLLPTAVIIHLLSAALAEMSSNLFWTPMEIIKSRQQAYASLASNKLASSTPTGGHKYGTFSTPDHQRRDSVNSLESDTSTITVGNNGGEAITGTSAVIVEECSPFGVPPPPPASTSSSTGATRAESSFSSSVTEDEINVTSKIVPSSPASNYTVIEGCDNGGLENRVAPRTYSMWQMAKIINAREGVTGFYRGYLLQLIVFVPYSMIYFSLYEQFKSFAAVYLTPSHNPADLPSWSFVLLAGTASSIAASISNIFD